MTSRSSKGAVRQVALAAMADSIKASVSLEGTFSLQNGKSQHEVHSCTPIHRRTIVLYRFFPSLSCTNCHCVSNSDIVWFPTRKKILA